MGASLALSLRNVAETLAISSPTVVEALFGRVTKATCDQRLQSWAEACLRNARIELALSGSEHMARGRTYLVMSNHQSLYDIPVLFHVIGPNLRMIGKKELFRVPVFGHAMTAAGFVEIDRSDRNAAIRSLQRARDMLSGGTHVWIAPEGTRSPTGELLPFKKGAFYLALETQFPILPVTVQGTRNVLPAHGLLSTAGKTVRVTIHAPIDPGPYTALGKSGRSQLMSDVRATIEAGL
jgi:1-acyl-sn-glycerol-3-phosphate acyltransferase